MFDSWKTKVNKLQPESFDFQKIWYEVKDDAVNDRFGLAKALLHCHEEDEQEEIIQSFTHECTLLTQCIFNHIVDDSILNHQIPTTMKGYLQYLIATDYNECYFTTIPSRIGMSILINSYQAIDLGLFRQLYDAISFEKPSYPNLSRFKFQPKSRTTRSESSSSGLLKIKDSNHSTTSVSKKHK